MRYILLIFSLAVWLATGRYFVGLDSIIDLVHFAAIPFFISYLLIFQPKAIKKNFKPYFILFVITTLLVAGYLLALSKTISYVRVNWIELPIAVYFLLSVYTILYFCRLLRGLSRNGHFNQSCHDDRVMIEYS